MKIATRLETTISVIGKIRIIIIPTGQSPNGDNDFQPVKVQVYDLKSMIFEACGGRAKSINKAVRYIAENYTYLPDAVVKEYEEK